jgi:hypothetical protein
MASRLFPFAASVADLISPSANRRAQQDNSSDYVAPNEPKFEAEPIMRQEDKEFLEGNIFGKTNRPRVTFSRHFRRTYQNTNQEINAFQNRFDQKDEEFIPTLPREGIVKALKKLRSEIFPILIEFSPGIWELGSDPDYWGGLVQKYLMCNVLLGPYEYGVQLSGTKYITTEDQVEEFDPSLEVPAEMTVEPVVDSWDNAEMLYYQQVVMCGKDVGTINEAFFIITYQDPPEDVIVQYLRKKRTEYDQRNQQFMFVLFHNLLVPYVFGKTPVF